MQKFFKSCLTLCHSFCGTLEDLRHKIGCRCFRLIHLQFILLFPGLCTVVHYYFICNSYLLHKASVLQWKKGICYLYDLPGYTWKYSHFLRLLSFLQQHHFRLQDQFIVTVTCRDQRCDKKHQYKQNATLSSNDFIWNLHLTASYKDHLFLQRLLSLKKGYVSNCSVSAVAQFLPKFTFNDWGSLFISKLTQ